MLQKRNCRQKGVLPSRSSLELNGHKAESQPLLADKRLIRSLGVPLSTVHLIAIQCNSVVLTECQRIGGFFSCFKLECLVCRAIFLINCVKFFWLRYLRKISSWSSWTYASANFSFLSLTFHQSCLLKWIVSMGSEYEGGSYKLAITHKLVIMYNCI